MEQLRTALRRYGTHLPGCPRWVTFGTYASCTCGLHEALGEPCPQCEQYSPRETMIEKLHQERNMSREQAERFIDLSRKYS